MNNRVKKLLYDILTSIENIDSYIGDEKILNINSDINISNSRRIVDARNKIIHGYDEIDNAQVWGIIINHLPKLKLEVEDLLNT